MIQYFLISFYVVFYFACGIDYMSSLLYFLQLNSYKINSLKIYFVDGLRKNYIYWFLYFVIAICLFILRVSNVYLLFVALVLSGVIMLLLGSKFLSLKKNKYTKRMARIIIVCLLLLSLGCYLALRFLPNTILVILFPLLVPFVMLISVLSILILSPIEYLIGKYYISKAKKKLSDSKKLIKIGITGSFGKTSTKEILNSILSENFNVLATPKSFNTPFGISKTINSSLLPTHEVFICEMGAKAKGEIKYLCDMVGVQYGIVTSVGRQHTDTFGGIEGVYKAKKELPDYLFNKTCVFNLMNLYVRQMYDEYIGTKVGVFVLGKSRAVEHTNFVFKKKYFLLKKIKLGKYLELYPFPKKNNYYAKCVKCTELGSNFKVFSSGKFLFDVSTILLGMHNVINILLAIALSKQLGVGDKNIVLGLSKLKPIKARLEKFTTSGGAIVLNNGYNSNIDSAKYTVETLSLFDRPNRVIITPGLVETEDDFTYNRKFGELISKYCTDVILVKEKNRNAIIAGLSDAKFDMCHVYSVQNFSDAKKVIDKADDTYVFLIENDLPDNYK